VNGTVTKSKRLFQTNYIPKFFHLCPLHKVCSLVIRIRLIVAPEKLEFDELFDCSASVNPL
jgi:hypothetical protein